MPKMTIPEKWLQQATNHYTSRFEIPPPQAERDSLVERYLGKVEVLLLL
jgi:hypothetical protein